MSSRSESSTKVENAEQETPAKPQRLQKVLAAAGIGSRRHCEEYILAGRVRVDGQKVQDLGTRVDPTTQKILLDDAPIRQERKQYYVVNKPTGYLCTNNDPDGRPRVIDLFPQTGVRLFTVGRLDENSQGLLLVTNDGELANRMAHPRYQIPKTYQVQVVGQPTRETLEKLRQGIYFDGGKFRVQGVRRIKSKGRSAFLQIVLNEGQNREIRRLLARVGHKVIHLERVAFGPLKLSRLALGQYRELRPTERKLLFDLDGADHSRGRRGKSKPTRSKPGSKPESKSGAKQRHASRPDSSEAIVTGPKPSGKPTRKKTFSKKQTAPSKHTTTTKRTASSKHPASTKRSVSTKRAASSKDTGSAKRTVSTKRIASGKQTASTKRTASGKHPASTKRTVSTKRAASGKQTASAKRTVSTKRTASSKHPASTKRTVSGAQTAAKKKSFSRKKTAAGKKAASHKRTGTGKR